ncbi:MAG: hypothetical protein H6Q20_1940 [Bacteroidetes bacterium]|nr:hypothetical protein [Bacteroidota bacterium]
MKDYIRSKFTKDTIFWSVFGLILPFPVGTYYLYKILIDFLSNNIASIGEILLSLLFFLIFIFVLNYFKNIRCLIIRKNKLKYYSILMPFGRVVNFDKYIGKIETSETGSGGSYKVVYFVDKNNRTTFKIMGLHYKKFGEIINAIPLRTMDFSPTTIQYFKLMFFERIKITETGANKENEKGVGSAQKIIQIVSLIGISLFVIGIIVKTLTKFG